MKGSVLSFLKAEWKVSDTGSAHWASSFIPRGSYKIVLMLIIRKHIFSYETVGQTSIWLI